jgi:hypothetical protein
VIDAYLGNDSDQAAQVSSSEELGRSAP